MSATPLAATLLALLLACGGSEAEDTDAAPEETGVAETGGEDTGEAPAPVDVDSDGVTDDEDCDDLDPRRYPGAEEVWDELDNDCDGRVDADGSYAGVAAMDAVGIYEGVARQIALTCALSLLREGDALDFTADCAPDAPDEWSDLLIGASLTLTPGDLDVEEGAWSGEVVFASSDGWDADGQGEILWSGMDAFSFSASLDTYYLDIVGGGDGALE